MTHFLQIRPAAEADLNEATCWYEDRREGLGSEFKLCVEEAFARLRANPLQFPVVHKDIRRGVIRRFPYGIFYRVVNETVVVLGVFHARRSPRAWQSRQ